MDTQEKIINLLGYVIECIEESHKDKLCDYEIEKMYELLREVKNS